MGEQAPPIPAKIIPILPSLAITMVLFSARSNVLSPRHSDIIARASPHLRRLYSPKLDKTLLRTGEGGCPRTLFRYMSAHEFRTDKYCGKESEKYYCTHSTPSFYSAISSIARIFSCIASFIRSICRL